nr:SDR family oxidoreductase [Amycolatopsis keratiniphila]
MSARGPVFWTHHPSPLRRNRDDEFPGTAREQGRRRHRSVQRDRRSGRAAARRLRCGGTALVLAADVADAEAMRAAAAEVEAKLGRADLLFNNAGVMLAAPIDELATGDWQRMIDVNMTGLMNAIGAFVPHLVASAAEKGVADLVNTSSIGAQAVFPSFAVYVASKAYVTHLSKNLRADLGPKGVRVAAIEPGLVETELQGHVTDAGALEWLDGARETLTWLKPEDIAETVAFLTSLPARVNLQQVTVMPTAQV